MRRTVVLVEDLDIVREGLRSLLEAHSDFEIAGEAGDGLEAVRQVERITPDLVLMDLSMPTMDGAEAIRDIKRRFPRVKILALTAHKSLAHIRGALAAGADGYVLKNTTAPELVRAMETVLSGGRYMSPDIPEALLEQPAASGPAREQPSALDRLSERELLVLRLTARGKGNKALARELCISVKTVEKHKANLVRKLGLRSASELAPFAHEYGLFD
jgi:DNA-binding NarL/FixJ family response regulator